MTDAGSRIGTIAPPTRHLTSRGKLGTVLNQSSMMARDSSQLSKLVVMDAYALWIVAISRRHCK